MDNSEDPLIRIAYFVACRIGLVRESTRGQTAIADQPRFSRLVDLDVLSGPVQVCEGRF